MTIAFSNLTSKQKKVYSAIETYIRMKGIPPTVREIGEMVGEKTPGAVQGILNRLEQKGVIKRQIGAARSIQLVSTDSQMYADPVFIPEIKKISKRNIDDLLNIYNINKYHPVSPDMVDSGENHLMFPCPDDSLSASGINRDDLLVVNTRADLADGDIVLAFYNTNTLLRYYHPSGETVKLKADLDLIGKEVFLAEEIRIVGRLVGKFTKY